MRVRVPLSAPSNQENTMSGIKVGNGVNDYTKNLSGCASNRTPRALRKLGRLLSKGDRGHTLKEDRIKNLGTLRNDPCPCGSGKKLKKCCLNTLEQENILE